jgi:hypothetical protein
MHRAIAPCTHLAAVIIAALALAAPAAGVPGPGAALHQHRAADAALQATSAELAMLRSRERALAGPSLAANRRRQALLERRKLRLLALEEDTRDRAVAAVERHRARARRAAREAERAAAAAGAASIPAPAPAAPAAPSAHGAAPPGDDVALAAVIDAYLASKSSPLIGQGAAFVAASRAVGLDPRFLVAIAGAETAFGTYGPSQGIRNPFGMGPGFVYPSWEESIHSAARNLGGNLYLGDGRVTIERIHERWAPIGAGNDPGGLNGHWPRNVAHYFAEQGGDPSRPVFGPPAAAAPAAPEERSVPADPARIPEAPAERAAAAHDPRDPERADATAPAGPPLVGRVFADPVSFGPMLDGAAR